MLSVSRAATRMTGMVARFSAGGHGDGAGRGGGSGGSIRDAGGAFGKMEAAREDEYFYKKQKAQLQELREHIQEEVKHHEGQLENHKKVLERHQQRISEIEAQERALGKE
ncbi:ATPase inhibitor mai-2, mitochondrial [Caenorhabditis elegans]|uniref:ATPase inhibitor mai-2, mitochondrial n=1 Tax=Caenorhabditis elegans TaxID=6239 RepID=ATIF2_CAEEL|nr:ATPase inhibitor mai-2, mitochondrial [Caenorhabditis elegans]O44441.1 RecName: Full=ATPase inhibitor mai-2, mitochondrial; AltName: Full=ATP synthase F1 subunit epsilon; Flags: Precursor [Caenorhabditis elegans]AAG49389.1 mitochondrial ATPase inhibitor [Caenorhabditis elegans]CCD62188.1 ATPase inhibitor mai-2, mitochondrial [Caenorhabditis elegans]|eukprot:NP_500336.1 ATPase inhibitor mai-2, mitochondrial [Caenorhabditis elegans]